MQIKTVALMALLFFAAPALAETSALKSCNSLFGSSFDCQCVAKFLEAQVDPTDLEIILPLWAYSLDGSGNHRAEFARFDAHYGHKKINHALHQFHLVRLELFMQCPASSPD